MKLQRKTERLPRKMEREREGKRQESERAGKWVQSRFRTLTARTAAPE